jgi:hypothetical protein
MKTITFFMTLLTMMLLLTGSAFAQDIRWQVISSGGSQNGSSATYRLSATVGQTAVGMGNSATYGLNNGYWQDFGGEPTACDCQPGNANGDATINIFDITYIISYLYLGGSAPVPYELCSGDPNKDCTCNIFDITYIISSLYLSGPPPATCEEWLAACGQPLRK